ncbi:MAG: redoxin domain-containing protein [Candidatus Omnitrophota bacterium]
MNRRRYLVVKILIGMIFLSFLSSAYPAEKEKAPLDAQADRLIRDVSQFLGGLQSLKVDIAVIVKTEGLGTKNELTTMQTLSFKRPSYAAVIVQKGLAGSTVICDGSAVTRFYPMFRLYTVENAPASIEDLTTIPPESTPAAMMTSFHALFIDFLFKKDPFNALLKYVDSGEYLGEEESNGVLCRHVRFSLEDLKWEMWVDAGKTPLIRKIAPDFSASLAKTTGKAAGVTQVKIEMSIEYDGWKINPELSENDFKFIPPEDAKKAANLQEGIDALSGVARSRLKPKSPPAYERLLGKPAPPFKSQLLGGGKFDLAVRQTEKIMVLDFWAAWCPPCRETLPLLAALAKEYKDKNVEFASINQQDEKEDIEKFLKDAKLNIPVILDENGDVGDAYFAESLPQTVIIDKNGIVRYVFIGEAPPMLQKKAKQALDDLLAGKKPGSPLEKASAKKKEEAVKMDMRLLSNSLEAFFIDNNSYPVPLRDKRTVDEAGLQISEGGRILFLTEPVTYLPEIPKDPFDPEGKPYRYFSNGKFYVLVSNGPDGKPDFDERTYMGAPLPDLNKFIYDPATGKGDIIRVGP